MNPAASDFRCSFVVHYYLWAEATQRAVGRALNSRSFPYAICPPVFGAELRTIISQCSESHPRSASGKLRTQSENTVRTAVVLYLLLSGKDITLSTH